MGVSRVRLTLCSQTSRSGETVAFQSNRIRFRKSLRFCRHRRHARAVVRAPVYAPKTAVRTGTVRTATLRQMERLDMERATPPVCSISHLQGGKYARRSWKQDRSGNYALLNSHPICKFSGNLGPKLMQGDHQAPEGFYDITSRSDKSQLEWSILPSITGFPNAYDRSLGRTGSFLMVHGGCRSRCAVYAMDKFCHGRDLRPCRRSIQRWAAKSSAAGLSLPHQRRRTWRGTPVIRICRFGRC